MKTTENSQTVQRGPSISSSEKMSKNHTTTKTSINSNSNDALFTSNLDFLVLKLLNIFTVNDKPVMFIFPVLLVVILNIYFGYFSKIYFALLMFFIYEWGCGNSLIGSSRDALVYFFCVASAILVDYLFKQKK